MCSWVVHVESCCTPTDVIHGVRMTTVTMMLMNIMMNGLTLTVNVTVDGHSCVTIQHMMCIHRVLHIVVVAHTELYLMMLHTHLLYLTALQGDAFPLNLLMCFQILMKFEINLN